MIVGFFMQLAARTGATGAWQRVLAVVLAVAALVALYGALRGAWAAFDWLNDREAVQDDRTRSNADAVGRTVKADRSAGANMTARDQAIANEQQRLEESAHDARRRRISALDDLSNQLR